MRLYSIGQLSNSEKSDILGKHREIYNGYKTMQPKVSNEQPLYTQDFAGDKNGLTVNNKGEVSSYSNKIYMKEQWQAFAADAIATELGAAEMAPLVQYGIENNDFINSFKSPTTEESEIDEVSINDLKKGKKYKYKSPSFEDELEYEDEHEYPQGGKMYSFKGNKGHGHVMGDKSIESFISHMEDTDEGIYDIEDLQKGEEFDYIKGDANLEEDLMELYEPMTSAFADELDEVTGPSPLYSEVDFPAYNFKSEGPMFAPHGVKEDELDEQFFEDQFGDDEDDDFGFESPLCPGCKGEGCEECSGSGMKRNSIFPKDERETAISRMRRGKGDIEDIDWEEITEGLDEDFKGSIMGLLKPKKKGSDKKPYTADAVQNIIKFIKNVKTEEQLESVMNMVNNLYSSNEDVNDAYKERITHAYKRKADELGNYLKKKDYDFEEVDEDLQESFIKQKSKITEMFNRMNKYN